MWHYYLTLYVIILASDSGWYIFVGYLLELTFKAVSLSLGRHLERLMVDMFLLPTTLIPSFIYTFFARHANSYFILFLNILMCDMVAMFRHICMGKNVIWAVFTSRINMCYCCKKGLLDHVWDGLLCKVVSWKWRFYWKLFRLTKKTFLSGPIILKVLLKLAYLDVE